MEKVHRIHLGYMRDTDSRPTAQACAAILISGDIPSETSSFAIVVRRDAKRRHGPRARIGHESGTTGTSGTSGTSGTNHGQLER